MSEKQFIFQIEKTEEYKRLVEAIAKNSCEELSEKQMHDAARNILGFYKTTLEIYRQIRKNAVHVDPH